jgi:DNA-binding SARP family transcriptional activator/tetratricopeptide (TPR) repeat protein
VEVGLLGPLELRMGNRVVSLSRRLRRLLGALALSAGRPVSVDVLADCVWGEDLPVRVRGSLATYVLRLRRILGDGVIVTLPDAYVLAVEPGQVDALRFLALVDAAARAGDEGQERRMLGEALDLWRGPALEGLGPVLESMERPRLTERRLLAWERRIDLDLAAGDAAVLVGELRELTVRHPLRESFWVRLINALRAADRPAEALECYEACRKALAEELGTDPGAELQRLYSDMLNAGAATSEGVPTLDGTDTSAGAAEAANSALAGSQSLSPQGLSEPPRQIPADSTRFVGREPELAILDTFLSERGSASREPTVVVAIDGPAGVGKTTLAVHWAHGVADRFPDGQLFLDLHGYSAERPLASSAALAGLLHTLGVAAGELPGTADERAALLRTRLAGRRMLVVLDNARSAEQVRPLLPGAGCLVVVTSRNQLRGLAIRDSAHRVTLRPLPSDDAVVLLGTAIGQDRVTEQHDAVRDLVELCGRFPLAVLVVGERVSRHPDLPLAGLVAELRDQHRRLDALGDTDDAANDLRAALSWSYDALDDTVATMFRRLGLHPTGEVSLAAAAALVGADTAHAARSLDRLVAVHLVEHRARDAYGLHDLVHTYARELADRLDGETERRDATERALDWSLHSAAGAAVLLRPAVRGLVVDEERSGAVGQSFADYDDALRWLEAQRPTLAAVVLYAHDHGWHGHAWKLAWLLSTFLSLRGYYDCWLLTARAGRDSARCLDDPDARYRSANNLGRVHGSLQNFEESTRYLQEALEICRTIGDTDGEWAILGNLGVNAWDNGDFAASVDFHEQALAASARADRPEGRATALHNLATTYAALRDYERAADYASEAQVSFEAIGEHRRAANAAAAVAEIHQLRGAHTEALEYGRDALTLLRQLKDDYAIADLLTALGRAHLARGEFQAARDMWDEALAIFTRLDHRRTHEVGALLADLASA